MRSSWKWTVGALITGAIAAGAWMVREDRDPCLYAGSEHRQMHPQNAFLSTCDGHLYLPTSSERRPYRRIDEVKVSEVEPLPFKYLKVSGQVYFIAVAEAGFDEDKHVLMPIKGIDGATTEVLDEGHIQDKQNRYTVMFRDFIVEPR